MVCVVDCGACCRRFTNDWLPDEIVHIPEEAMKSISPRSIIVNGKSFTIYSDTQEDHNDYYCRNLRKTDGRCQIHSFHPFSCDFELLRFKEGITRNWLGHSPFGRVWKMKKIDGTIGGSCEWKTTFCADEWIEEVIRRLERLLDWTDYFQIDTVIPNIIGWVERGPHTRGIVLNSRRKGFGLCQTMSQD